MAIIDITIISQQRARLPCGILPEPIDVEPAIGPPPGRGGGVGEGLPPPAGSRRRTSPSSCSMISCRSASAATRIGSYPQGVYFA